MEQENGPKANTKPDVLERSDTNDNSSQNNVSEREEMEEEDFAIPELPSGSEVSFVLISAWDDPFFMGLNAIEIFTDQGARADISNIETDASESFGELPSLLYCKSCPCTDPRGMWLCRHTPDNPPITVTIRLSRPQTVAMIRIWNYCESRVHALRGVRRMRIELDKQCIFKGEISCAFSGDSHETGKPLGDTILFTTNETILNSIAENDVFLTESEDTAVPTGQLDVLSLGSGSENDKFSASSSSFGNLDEIRRPVTGYELSSSVPSSPATFMDGKEPAEPPTLPPHPENPSSESNLDSGEDENETNIVKGKLFHMELSANWGAPDLIGLTGIQFLGPNSQPIPTDNCIVRCSTESGSNANTLQRLLNCKNLTCQPENMWLTPWANSEDGSPPVLSFTFPQEVELTGVSVWNYNASPELTYAGVKCAQFFANGRPLVNAVLLRRAPGYVFFDYVQDIMFDRCHLFRPLTSRPNTHSISAFIFQLRLLSSWGDEFYIGLNGIELYNRRNHLMKLKLQNLAAFPESVNVLPTVNGDPRSSEKLIDGVNDTNKPQHMWLTPILPNRYGRIFLIFDSPTFLSRIRIFNYRKTPERGVRHIAVSADDLIIYSGEVPQSSSDSTGVLDISLRDLN
ncbi:Protein KATNIP like protein [Ditylenchus destructor]|uniref:Protein KATNIP like protein n=1 Tax=Ditylenchus destructor TaxID=166010 RepID=A0AAD4MWG5_9BILA|nr:Protein KATNIP like protein [Ditylenchus destructor]